MKDNKTFEICDLFPDPASNFFVFTCFLWRKQNCRLSVSIFDPQRQKVLKKEIIDMPPGISQNSIKLDGLQKGLFHVEFEISGLMQTHKLRISRSEKIIFQC